MAVSVSKGKCGPCCSMEPRGTRNTRSASFRASSQLRRSISIEASRHCRNRVFCESFHGNVFSSRSLRRFEVVRDGMRRHHHQLSQHRTILRIDLARSAHHAERRHGFLFFVQDGSSDATDSDFLLFVVQRVSAPANDGQTLFEFFHGADGVLVMPEQTVTGEQSVNLLLAQIRHQRLAQRGAVQAQLLADPGCYPNRTRRLNLFDQNRGTLFKNGQMDGETRPRRQLGQERPRMVAQADSVQSHVGKIAEMQAETIPSRGAVTINVTVMLERVNQTMNGTFAAMKLARKLRDRETVLGPGKRLKQRKRPRQSGHQWCLGCFHEKPPESA